MEPVARMERMLSDMRRRHAEPYPSVPAAGLRRNDVSRERHGGGAVQPEAVSQ